jgi:hypothetical protein
MGNNLFNWDKLNLDEVAKDILLHSNHGNYAPEVREEIRKALSHIAASIVYLPALEYLFSGDLDEDDVMAFINERLQPTLNAYNSEINKTQNYSISEEIKKMNHLVGYNKKTQ